VSASYGTRRFAKTLSFETAVTSARGEEGRMDKSLVRSEGKPDTKTDGGFVRLREAEHNFKDVSERCPIGFGRLPSRRPQMLLLQRRL
jgi:hypothetical protein